MGWFSKKKEEPPPPKPEPPPVPEPEFTWEQQLSMAYLKASYGDIMSTLYDRHILQRVDFQGLLKVTAPPALSFPKPFEGFKILPPAHTTPQDMERFWNNMRAMKQPMALELISKPEGMCFGLSVPKMHAQTVEQQLNLHFPTATIIPDSGSELRLGISLCARSYAPEHSSKFLESKSLFQDPYASLFSYLDEDTGDVGMQIICCPIPEEGIAELCKLLEWKEPGIPLKLLLQFAESNDGKYWHTFLTNNAENNSPFFKSDFLIEQVCEKIHDMYENDEPFSEKVLAELIKQKRFIPRSLEQAKGLERKQPPWVMCVNVFAEKNEELDQLAPRFLSLFETKEQSWKTEELDDETEGDFTNLQHHPIPHWNIVSTQELTTIAHFPTQEATSERLETSSGRKSIPPDEYTIG